MLYIQLLVGSCGSGMTIVHALASKHCARATAARDAASSAAVAEAAAEEEEERGIFEEALGGGHTNSENR